MSTLTLSTIIDQFGALDAVTDVSYKDRALTNIDDLSQCVQLRKLDVSNNKLNNVLFLSRFTTTSLSWLSLANNSITTIAPLQCLTQLKVLNIGYNNVTDISAVSQCKQLVALIANNNKVVHIPPTLPPTLNTLILSHNSVSDWQAVGRLTRLTKLSLSYNKLFGVPDQLKYCVDLAELRLNHNNITVLPTSLQLNTRLKLIDLAHNNIAELADAAVLHQLPYLRNLAMIGNPISTSPDYSVTMQKLCPLLYVFDYNKVDQHTSDTPAQASKGSGKTNTEQKDRQKPNAKHVHIDNADKRDIKPKSPANAAKQPHKQTAHQPSNKADKTNKVVQKAKSSVDKSEAATDRATDSGKKPKKQRTVSNKPQPAAISTDVKFASAADLMDISDSSDRQPASTTSRSTDDHNAAVPKEVGGVVTVAKRTAPSEFSVDALVNNAADQDIGTGGNKSAWD